MAHIFHNDLNENAANFDITVDELTEEHPRADQPSNCNIPLRPHQLTLLKRCIDIENNTLRLKDFQSVADQVDERDTVTTRVAILGERVGAGKSYVILSLIKMNNIVTKEDRIIKSYGLNNVIFSLVQKNKVIPTNLLIIPHNITAQWVGYCNAFSNDLKYIVVNKKTINEFLEDKIEVTDYDLIIVTSTYYNRFASFFTINNMHFKKI